MPTIDIDGIATHYAIAGSGPPILMMAPGGFASAIEKWSTTWPCQHFLPLYLQEGIPGATYWNVHLESQAPEHIPDHILTCCRRMQAQDSAEINS